MERKLATIQRISGIHPIKGADFLERAEIRGWNVVVKKGEFKEGDPCVYCEIDSVMPEWPQFEFLAKYKYRIKTMKFKGQISQGIAFPITTIPEEYFKNGDRNEWDLGADCTDILEITKYDPPMPACLGGIAEGKFFSHSIKTDEERIQNLTEIFQDYHDWYTWTATEKLDGSSCTYTVYEDKFGVASRNLRLKEHPDNEKNSFWKYARDNDVEGKMRKIMSDRDLKGLTLQGELIGEGIQKNKYKIKGQEVRFFRAFDPIAYSFFSFDELRGMCEITGLKWVPLIETDLTLPDTVEELILMADGRSALYDTAREGIVFVAESVIGGMDARPLENYQGRLSFKVISNKFILKHDA